MKSWHCVCGYEGMSEDHVEVVFHLCKASRRGSVRPAHRDEERRQWAERQLGANPFTEALEDELGDRALRGEEE